MDELTRIYRKKQIEKVQENKSKYNPKIKIVNEGSKTNYLDISFDELEKIKEILTK